MVLSTCPPRGILGTPESPPPWVSWQCGGWNSKGYILLDQLDQPAVDQQPAVEPVVGQQPVVDQQPAVDQPSVAALAAAAFCDQPALRRVVVLLDDEREWEHQELGVGDQQGVACWLAEVEESSAAGAAAGQAFGYQQHG